MISIIICHRNADLLTNIKKSIESTIGVPYELIVIDNTNNQYTILSAYTEGVKRAKYNLLCFTHEDILFYTNDWGKRVETHFNDPEVGMIGVAGGMSQSIVPSAWWFNGYFAKCARNMLMRSNKKDKKLYHYCSNPFNEAIRAEVIIVDGLWFCIRKELFQKISFDQKLYKGFHLYDADISMQVHQYAKNYVVYDILVEHIWSGKISKDYYIELEKFSNKWNDLLPVKTSNLTDAYMKIYNWHALRYFILEMRVSGFSKEHIREVYNTYYPLVKKYNSLWFKSYFLLARIIGYAPANSIFYRLEKLFGVCKLPDYSMTEYKVP